MEDVKLGIKNAVFFRYSLMKIHDKISKFSDKICSIPEIPLSTLSFNDLKYTGCAVIILYGSSIRPDFAWNKGSFLTDPWLNKQDKDSLFSALDSNLEKGQFFRRIMIFTIF